MSARAAEAGFTLIEALVAMAVLALGAVSLLSATEGHSARISAVTDRTAARWVADHALTSARLGLEPAPDVQMLGRRFRVSLDRAAVGESGLDSLSVSVFATTASGDSTDTSLYVATGYRITGNGS